MRCFHRASFFIPLKNHIIIAFFQRNESALVLWSYSLELMIPLCKEIEEKLIKYIWRTRTVARRSTPSLISGISAVPSSIIGSGFAPTPTSQPASSTGSQSELNEKEAAGAQVTRSPSQRGWWSWRLQPRKQPPGATQSPDPEKGAAGKRQERKLMLFGPLYAGIGAALALCAFSFLFTSFFGTC